MKLPENLTPRQDALFESYPNGDPDCDKRLYALQRDLLNLVVACREDNTATAGEKALAEAVLEIALPLSYINRNSDKEAQQ